MHKEGVLSLNEKGGYIFIYHWKPKKVYTEEEARELIKGFHSFYYTGAVACWLEAQNGFEGLTEEQEKTLLILEEKGEIKFDYSHYSLEKITYFLSIMPHIREEARAFAEKHAIK